MGSPTSPLSPALSEGQLRTLAANGEERTAAEGEFLFRIGDASYPLIVVLEGEAAILDSAGNEIVRQGAGGFMGEVGLLSGQTVYVDGVVTKPMRYIAVDRDDLRRLLFEDEALADMLLNTFIRRRESSSDGRALASRSSGPAPRRPPATCSTMRGAVASRTSGAIPRAPTIGRRRLWSPISSRRSCRSCACRVGPSFATRATASFGERSGSDWSWSHARRWISP